MKIELYKLSLMRRAGERAVKHAQASLKLKWRNITKMLDLNGINR
jgi:hypothetical protein